MSEFLKGIMPFFDQANGMIVFAVSLGGLVLLSFFKSFFVGKNKDSFLGASLFSFYRPAKTFFVFFIAWTILEITNNAIILGWKLANYPAIKVLFAIHFSWYAFRVINVIEEQKLTLKIQGKLDSTAIIGLAKIARLVISGILIIVVFDLLGLDPSGLIALGSISGAAVAFASKDLVSNMFGGIMLYLDKPFKVGDWIRSSDQEIEGVVEYIGWRMSVIRTFDKRPLYIPNSIFNVICVENPSRMTHRRIFETIGIRYNDLNQTERVVNDIEKMLNTSELIDHEQVIIVNLNEFGRSSLNIMVYCMTKTTQWVEYHKHKQTILLAIADIVSKHNCEFAFPTQTLEIKPNKISEFASKEIQHFTHSN